MTTEDLQENTPQPVPVDRLIKVYLKIRDARTELKEKFEAEDKSLQTQIDLIQEQLLEVCRQNGVDSLKTPYGTAMRKVTTRYWTQDWESMHKFIKDHDALHLLEKRISQTAMKEFLEANPDDHPPGLSSNSEYQITIRRSK